MARPAPNKRIIAIVLSVVFVVMTLLTGVLATLKNNPYEDLDKPSSSDVEVLAPTDESSDAPEPPDEPSSESGEESSEPPEQEPEPETPPAENEPVFFNVPDEMRAVMLVAGRDFMTSETDTSKAAIATQIDRALNAAKELTMNTIIIDTKYKDGVLFSTSTLQRTQTELDCVDYAVTKARELGFYVYATYDVTDTVDGSGNYRRAASADGDTLDDVMLNVGEFAAKYKFDGILLNNYYQTASAVSYAQYNQNGGGMGYNNYLRQTPRAQITAACASIRKNAPGTQIGLIADAVWENGAANPDGSETTADFTALGGGNADTRAFVQEGLFDFVVVNNADSTVTTEKAPFRTVAEWWSKLARESNVTLYTLHSNEKLGNVAGGWSVMEQLTKQLIDQEKIGGYAGSVFNSLKALEANPGNTTTTLVQYMNDQIDETYVLSQLAISKPAQTTFNTKEPSVTFQGASDPREPVTINGEKIPTNESGYFTVKEDLKAGLNTFAIAHKSKTFTYHITREIVVIKDVQPVGSINVEGGMSVTVSALAYEGASVSASIGGQSISLSLSDTDDDNTDRDSGYKLYTGVFTAPSASASATKMGNITFTGTSVDGITMSLEGASVTVNKKAQMGDGAVVYVVADQAETFPINTLNDNSTSSYYPLPKGTVDMTYGDEVVYKDGKKSYSYRKLQSGVRVYSSDISATGAPLPDNNAITAMSVKSSGAYTTISLSTQEKVPYTVAYDGNKIVFKFQYTAKAPQSETLSNNALFKSAEWSGSDLTLELKKAGAFLGYKAYYEGSDLVLRFNNSPGTLSGARIVVDPGHGGDDPGALGFYPGKNEADVNLAIAKKLVSELKSRGASVLMVTPGSTMASRLASARAFNPQALVSVHSNTSGKASAKGTEVYYFYPFQKQLAANISANVASALGTDNRGAKSGLYYMTRESQFASVLVETGFLSNENEYTKLINSKYQSKIADAIANGVSSYLGGTNSGGGTVTVDDEEEETDVEDEEEDEEESTGTAKVTGVSLNKNEISLSKGETYPLKATVKPSQSADKRLKWKSDDEDVVKVDSSGVVTAVGEGTAWITVTTRDGDYSADCDVTVQKEDTSGGYITKITISGEKKLSVGTRTDLSATVSPKNAADKGVKWSSSDESILALPPNFITESSCKIEGKRNGTATITATAYDDGKVEATLKVTVGTGVSSGSSSSSSSSNSSSTAPEDGVRVRSVSIDGPSSIERGSRAQYTGSVSPSNAQDQGVQWEVSDSDILGLMTYTGDQENICKVEGLRTGEATLIARAYDDKSILKKITIRVK